MYWETKEDFDAWYASDSFKESHKRPASGSEEAQGKNPILKNTVIMAELVAAIDATEPAK